MSSIGATAIAHQGRTTGFDYLRLGLALAVVIYHSAAPPDWMAVPRGLVVAIVPAFFALSGFLVTGSLYRNTIPQFITLRVIRIVPALAFEIALSALLIGTVFTRLPFDQYFQSPQFSSYFLNILGDIHYFLPGVFNGNTVNLQLWTIPYELKCYAILVGLALAAMLPGHKLFPALLLVATLLLTAWAAYRQAPWSPWRPSGVTLVVAFLWACVIYLFRDRIPYHGLLAAGALLGAVLLLSDPRWEVLAALPIAYLTIYIGLMALPPIKFGDLSYGMFLFHYPILQTLRFGTHITTTGVLPALTIVISCLCAAISWTFIEHPVLRRKRAILGRVDQAIAWVFHPVPARAHADVQNEAS